MQQFELTEMDLEMVAGGKSRDKTATPSSSAPGSAPTNTPTNTSGPLAGPRPRTAQTAQATSAGRACPT